MGRGLNEIFGDDDDDMDYGVSPAQVKRTEAPKDFAKISLDKIDANPDQPRKEFEPEALEELIASIKENGVIQPILVEKRPSNRYLIIAGERRFRASVAAGLKEIPAVIKDNISQQKVMELALIENIQRENLTPLEEAIAYKNLMESHSMNQEEVAELVGKKRATVANSLRLLKLPEELQEAVNQKTISMGHAKVLLSVTNPSDQLLLCRKIIDEALSVREAEKLAAQYNSNNKGHVAATSTKSASTPLTMDPELMDFQYKLMTYLGTKVSIKGSLEKGKIEVEYLSSDDLNRLYELFVK